MKQNRKYIAGATLALLGAGALSGCQQEGVKTEDKAVQNKVQTSNTEQASTTQTSTTSQGQASSQSAYKDGTYTGMANGYHPNLNVQVVVSGGKIASVSIGDNDETPQFLSRAKTVTSDIVNKQTPKVSAVSGATRSSNGIMKATENALSKAM